MRTISLSILFIAFGFSLSAQVTFTAKDTVPPYQGYFRAGTNFGQYPGYSDEFLAEIAAGSPALGTEGLSIKTVRPGLFEDFLYLFGYDSRLSTYELFDDLGLKDNTLIVGFPAPQHQDPTEYCPGIQSTLFSNMYEDIWDNGENGTPINDNNHYALYMYNLVTMYGQYIKFYEIWNEPGFDYTENHGFLPPGEPGNWWDENPDPCDYKLRAPIMHYVRLLRISYDVIKTVDPESYVAVSGVGYPSFLDAILRNTDNPFDGTVNADYPHKGGAYFDVMGFHSYPHFDGSLRYWDNDLQDFVNTRHSDAAADGVLALQDDLQSVLDNYGYDGNTYPQKPWLITEINLPRKPFGDFIGTEESQRNFMIKNIVVCMQNNFLQSHIFKLAEDKEYDNAFYEFDLMGLYKKLDFTNGYFQEPNDEGISYKTVSELLFGTAHDPDQTALLNLPQGVKGGAFKDDFGNYTYVLWAETSIDNSEAASATYTFPAGLGVDNLIKREWDYGTTYERTSVASNNISLTGAPIFLSEMSFSADITQGCAPQIVQFTDQTPTGTATWSWTFEGGTPETSNLQNPTVTYNQPGNFNATLQRYDAGGVLLGEQTDLIKIGTLPQADFTSNINGALINFSNTSSTNTNTFHWDFGDGNTSSVPSPDHLFLESGTYTVQLTATNHCGSTTQTTIMDITVPGSSQLGYTANDQVAIYDGQFRPGSNTNFFPPWTDEQIGNIAAGNINENVSGAGVKSFRTILPHFFLEFWGYDVEVPTYEHYNNIDLRDNVTTVGFPSVNVQDSMEYCPNERSILFENLYTEIWDGGANGTPINDENEYASYLYKAVDTYKDNIRFWEILSGPDFDPSGEKGWLPPGEDGNWWENDPEPCDYALHAPIQHYVRMLRISYEVIKTVDPDSYVTLAGIGFPSFLDAVLRNTDNPIDGSVVDGYPLKGGAYFDAVAYNSLPHFDGSTSYYDIDVGGFVYERHSDAAADGIVNLKEDFQAVLDTYGYDGTTYPEKQWYIAACNIPRKQFDDYIGSDEAHRNFIIKAYINSIKNNIVQFHVRQIAETATYENANDPVQLMGLYKDFEGGGPYTQTINNQGKAYKTASDLLFGSTYDPDQTELLNLPDEINGAAFYDGNGDYSYVLWAKTLTDQSEIAAATYTFPESLGLLTLNKKEWDWSETGINIITSTTDVALTGTPIFMTEAELPLLPPLAQFSVDDEAACPGQVLQFQDASNLAESWLWTFEGGTPATSTLQNPTVTFDTPGSYQVSLEAINAAGSHTAVYYDYIFISEDPTAEFVFTVDGPWATFTNESVGATSYLWDFGDGQTTGGFHPEHFYFNNGTYDVVLVAFNECGSDTITQQVVLNSPPQAFFHPAIVGDCNPYTVHFQDQTASNPNQWNWSFPGGNPTNSTQTNPWVTYDSPGIYEATLIVTNNFGSDTLTVPVDLDTDVIFNYNETLCSNDSVLINGNYYSINNPIGTEILSGASNNGCDSIVIIEIQNGDTAEDIFATICSNEVYDPGGWELTEAGFYTFTEINTNGCDHITSLTLEVDSSYFIQINDTILQGESYPFGDSLYTMTGIYGNFFTASNGCDSVVQLNLFVDIVDGVYDFSNEINLSYFPNPFEEEFTIQFDLYESSSVSIDLYDVRGIRVEQLQDFNLLQRGNHSYTFKNSSLAQGVYLLHFRFNDRAHTYRLVHL